MKKKKSLSKIRPSKRPPEFGLQILGNICLIDLETLKEHEQIRPDYLEELKNEIVSDGILKMPIAVDKTTYIILDGHHRLHTTFFILQFAFFNGKFWLKEVGNEVSREPALHRDP